MSILTQVAAQYAITVAGLAVVGIIAWAARRRGFPHSIPARYRRTLCDEWSPLQIAVVAASAASGFYLFAFKYGSHVSLGARGFIVAGGAIFIAVWSLGIIGGLLLRKSGLAGLGQKLGIASSMAVLMVITNYTAGIP